MLYNAVCSFLVADEFDNQVDRRIVEDVFRSVGNGESDVLMFLGVQHANLFYSYILRAYLLEHVVQSFAHSSVAEHADIDLLHGIIHLIGFLFFDRSS